MAGLMARPAGVIVLLMWFYPQSFAIVLGGKESMRISAEMDHQTAVHTKRGPPAPMGQRGASVAAYLWIRLGESSE